jgi:transcriptional regulator with GAF, ATPase, and Fis domain
MATRDLLLLSELASAIGAVHSFAATARACAEVLHRRLPLHSFELARRDPAQPVVHCVVCTFHASELVTTQRQRPLGETPLSGTRAPLPGVTVLEFRAEGETSGYAALTLAGGKNETLPQVFTEALTRVMQVAIRNIQLVERVASLSRRAHVENQMLRSELQRAVDPERVATVSESSRRVLAMADLVASQDTTVLLRGESGTGKEILARRIHRLSARANRPFLKINCGALPEGLVESTLFGHEKGAFTGATAVHRGFFERAHNGTLLLDEVAELPLGAQAKLLRVLQDGELERVGGETTQSVDVRLIAATHRPIEQMIERGTFRADLYYRLNIFPITLPPLREREEDIPVLVEVLLEKLARRHERPPPLLTPGVLDLLRRHHWPGNVRELENLLERALILTPGREALVLPSEFVAHSAAPARRPAGADSRVQSYEETMRSCIERALLQSGGQIYGPAGAAALLALKPTTLQSKMRKLRIKREGFLKA